MDSRPYRLNPNSTQTKRLICETYFACNQFLFSAVTLNLGVRLKLPVSFRVNPSNTASALFKDNPNPINIKIGNKRNLSMKRGFVSVWDTN